MDRIYLSSAACFVTRYAADKAVEYLRTVADEAPNNPTRLCLLGAIVAIEAGATPDQVAAYLREPETV